jgi:hypothetical protein
MSMMEWFVLTPAQSNTSMTLDADGIDEIAPMVVTGAAPGTGSNLNAQANGFVVGAVITLAGNYVAPKRIVDNPDYQNHCPALVTFLWTLPMCLLDNDLIFAPIDEQ